MIFLRFQAFSRMALAFALAAIAMPGSTVAQPGKDAKIETPPKSGLLINGPKAFKGYTLIAPMTSMKTQLIDIEGKAVRTWTSDCTPALGATLLENGHLLRTGSLGAKRPFGGPGAGGRIQEFDWDGNLVWDFTYVNDKQVPHHDICRMPNGNILMVIWERKTAEEAIAVGRRPESVKGEGYLTADAILEIKPTGKTTGEIVWEWHAWDHLIQDFDKTKSNYDSISKHPELIDINFGEGVISRLLSKKDDLDKLRSLGYLGGASTSPGPANGPAGGPMGGGGPKADWTHFNGIDYNAELDQIAISVFAFSEVWTIDHSTSKAEAAGHSGGRYGKGGDLLYRWGNPRAYRTGTNGDQRLFEQHNIQWIPKDRPGAGNLLVFNNGGNRPDGTYSSVDEIVPPMTPDGKYTRKPGLAFGPDRAVWSYTAPEKMDFFSMLISGAQRQPNGNTLICSGMSATVFEVTPEKDVVWKFVNPASTAMAGGAGGAPAGKFSPPQPGQLMPPFFEERLALTAEQKQQIEELQKDVTVKMEKILTDDQKRHIKGIREMMARMPGPPGMGGGRPGFGPPGMGGMFGPPGMGGGTPGGPPGMPGMGMGMGMGPGGLFRAPRYGPDFPGLAGKKL